MVNNELSDSIPQSDILKPIFIMLLIRITGAEWYFSVFKSFPPKVALLIALNVQFVLFIVVNVQFALFFNRILQSEYDQLKQAQYEQQTKSPYDNVIDEIQRNGELSSESRDAEMIAEAKLLRQHKGRLEARMQILEDHNNQLDAQLRRLRELLAEQVGMLVYDRLICW